MWTNREKEGDAKLRELILYISQRCEADPRFGATKLNKILFFSDALAFGRMRSSITGQEYQRLEFGPAPRRLLPVRQALEGEGALAMQIRDHFGQDQKRPVALRPANLDSFTGAQIACVDEVIAALWGRNATEVSELSHRLMGWKLANEGEAIPMESVFLARRDLSSSERAHATTLTM